MSLSAVLVIQSRMALGLSQGKYGELLGIGKRTVQRWEGGGAIVLQPTIQTLASAVHSIDPALAARIATNAGTSLLQLGIEKPPLPPAAPAAPQAPPLPPPLPTSTLVDSIVCVAADAIGVLPRAIRPALAAAFQRAREVRLDVGAVADSLGGGDGAGRRPGQGRGRVRRG
jgi:hypothetical protein